MPSLLQRLADLCRESPLREKIVVVPSLAIGHQIGDALARAGTPWINLRFETTRTIADAVIGLQLAREGISVLSRAQALALIEHACDRVLDDSSYFASLRGSPGLHRAIQRSIDDLRLAGAAASLPPSAFEDPRKARDLERIVAAYEEELATRKLIDRPGVVARAIAKLNVEAGASPARRPERPPPHWIFSDELELSHEESRLVAFASREAISVSVDDPPMPKLDALRVVSAIGEENEVRAVLRAILRDGARYDDAELIYTTRDPYLPLIFELSNEYGVEATFAEGIAVSFTSPGEACLAFLRWCGDGWNAIDLELAARAGSLKSGDDTLPPATLARTLRAASIGWGVERHRTQLEALVATRQAALADDELADERLEARKRELANAQSALRWMAQLLDLVTPMENFPLASAAKRFVEQFARVKSDRDAMALAALRRMFDELVQLPAGDIPLVEATARLRDAVLALYVGASNPRPSHLHVTPLRSAAWSGRARLFLAGLGESQFPGAGLQDPIVLDAERENLNRQLTRRQLALLGEAPIRASERLRRCLARAPKAQWTISFSSMSLRERREAFPAGDLLDIYCVARGRSEATVAEMLEEASVTRFVDADSPLGATEWWLGERFIERRTDYRETLRRNYRWLARGDDADAARAGDELTRWDGVVPIEAAAIDPRLTGRVLSASQIERMAGCPFGWFLRHVLRVSPPEELIRDPEVWLDPRNLGLLLHEIFEATMQRLCEAHVKPEVAAHLPLMTRIAEESMARWRVTIPPPNEAAFARQREEVLRTCATFLRVEEEACRDAEAMFFEVPFGFAGAAAHPAGLVEPLVIDLGGGQSVKVRGRIDRVDRTPRGTWRVWDYKTGSLFGWQGGWKFSRGRKVQHAIYARALIEALRARGIDDAPVIEDSGYFFPTPKGGGERIAKVTMAGELEEVLNRTFDVIASGFFAHPTNADDCRFCDFADVCGGADAAANRAREKYAANESSAMVARWRRLGEVV